MVKQWNHGFETHMVQGCVCVFSVSVLYAGSGLAVGQTTAKQFYQMSQFLNLYRVSIQPLFSNIASLLLLLGIIHPLVEFMHYLNGSRASGNKLLLSCHLL